MMTEAKQFEQFMALDAEHRQMLLDIAQLTDKRQEVQVRSIYPMDIEASPITIFKAVCKILGVSAQSLKQPCRERIYTQGRFMASHLLRGNGATLKSIADLFCRDHSTIIYACEVHRDLVHSPGWYKRTYNRVLDEIRYPTLDRKAVAV